MYAEEEILRGMIQGAFYGAQAALYGFMKSNELPISWTVIFTRKFWESFDPIKAIKTVTLGALMGAFTRGMSFIPDVTWGDPTGKAIFMNFANTAIVMGADQFTKFVIRRTPLIRIWNALKHKLGFI